MTWYESDGYIIATCQAHTKKSDLEETIYAFSYYENPLGKPIGGSHSSGGKDDGAGSGNSLREDYGDPEDLYEDGEYNDLDEAWDEWEEGW